MPKTILDYTHSDTSGTCSIDVRRVLEILRLSYSIADTASRAFFELYELVQGSSDEKLRREAHKRFSHAAVELAALLHELQRLGQGVR